jgi:hypothetical protein
MIDIEKAILVPHHFFTTPKDVIQSENLSRDQKIKILRSWDYDARELAVAEEENMVGTQEDILDQIISALRSLDVKYNLDDTSPTKQGAKW